MNKKLALAVIAIAAIASSAQAEGTNVADKGFYVSATGGLNLLNSTNLSESGISLKTDFDNGGFAAGAIGYQFGNLRAEGEVGYRHNDVSKIAGVDINTGVGVWSVMANGYIRCRACNLHAKRSH